MKKKIQSGCLYVISLFLISNLYGCTINECVKNNDGNLKEYDLYEEHFDTYTTKEIVDSIVQQKYRFENIVIGINKKTNEVSRYIYYHGDSNDYLYNNVMKPQTPGELTELFNLDTGNLIFFHNTGDSSISFGSENLDKLLSENDLYFLWNLDEDIIMNFYDNYDYKSWYTIDEINEIANMIIDKKLQVKRLELTTK